MTPLPGYLHVYRFRGLERVELKAACPDHGTWHTWPLQAEYRAGTVVRRTHSHHSGQFLTIEIQAHDWMPEWECGQGRAYRLSAEYARFALRQLEPAA